MAEVLLCRNDPPLHPLTGKVLFHQDQFRAQVVRVHEDADLRYARDPRWMQATDQERRFAVGLVNQLCGNEYRVISVDRANGQQFYNLLIFPKIRGFDYLGVPQQIGYAFVPADYVTVVRSGFPEAS